MGRRWGNAALIVASVALCTIAAEFVVRQLDAVAETGPATGRLDEIALASGVFGFAISQRMIIWRLRM